MLSRVEASGRQQDSIATLNGVKSLVACNARVELLTTRFFDRVLRMASHPIPENPTPETSEGTNHD
jgi:hypothetical protein